MSVRDRGEGELTDALATLNVDVEHAFEQLRRVTCCRGLHLMLGLETE
jgi:hypothetical protein